MTQREQIEKAARVWVKEGRLRSTRVCLHDTIDFALAQVEKATAELRVHNFIPALYNAKCAKCGLAKSNARHDSRLQHYSVESQVKLADRQAREECARLIKQHRVIEGERDDIIEIVETVRDQFAEAILATIND